MLSKLVQRFFMGFDARRVFMHLAVAAILGTGTSVSPSRSPSPSPLPYRLPAAATSADRARPTAHRVSAAELEREVSKRLLRVEEFKFIRAEAEKLGVRVYLFGGTAAGFAHYVKWDLMREKGDTRFQPDRFDYDFVNVYRSTQDLDIVVDGSPADAQKLAQLLLQKFPSFQGSKDQWEVRLLRQDMGDKQALLNNPDFLNQHTDSNSTGLIEITERSHEATVKDLRDWDSKRPQFLRDVADGKIHYYFSTEHETTSRFEQGMNPPILSVIRFLTKAFQYELSIRPEDEAMIKKIIAEFDPSKDRPSDYVTRWLEKNGAKLVRHAVNVEYAWNELERLGLRRKLIALSLAEREGTMGWWLSKEPMRSIKIGEGTGKTARELGIDVVAHETNSFLAYESITRAHTGEPNVFISRTQAVGEAAAHGEGFYTARGRKGMRNTGWTVRFKVHPNAREGKDFVVAGEIVVFRNKKALRVIPESLNGGVLDFLRLVETIDASDRGVLEKLKRRINNRSQTMTAAEVAEAKALVLAHRVETWRDPLLGEWLQLAPAMEHLDLLERLVDEKYQVKQIVDELIAKKQDARLISLVDRIVKKGNSMAKAALLTPLSYQFWRSLPQHREWVRKIVVRDGHVNGTYLFVEVARPGVDEADIAKLLKGGEQSLNVLRALSSVPGWKTSPVFRRAIDAVLADPQTNSHNFLTWVKGLSDADAKTELGRAIESYLLTTTDFGSERMDFLAHLHRQLHEQKTPGVDAVAFSGRMRSRLAERLGESGDPRTTADLLERSVSHGTLSTELVASKIRSQLDARSFGTFSTVLKHDAFAKPAIAKAALGAFVRIPPADRLQLFDNQPGNAFVVLRLLKLVGPEGTAVTEAVHTLRAGARASNLNWKAHVEALAHPVDSSREIQILTAHLATAPSGDRSLNFLESEWVQNVGSRLRHELLRPGVAETYLEALVKTELTGDRVREERRTRIAMNLALSPLVVDPTKRRALDRMMGAVQMEHRSQLEDARKLIALFDAPNFDYDAFISTLRDFGSISRANVAFLAFANSKSFDFAKFLSAFEKARAENRSLTEASVRYVTDWLIASPKFDPARHKLLLQRLEGVRIPQSWSGPLIGYLLRTDMTKRDPEFVDRIFELVDESGSKPGEVVTDLLLEAQRLQREGGLTSGQRELLARLDAWLRESGGMDGYVRSRLSILYQHPQALDELRAVDFYLNEIATEADRKRIRSAIAASSEKSMGYAMAPLFRRSPDVVAWLESDTVRAEAAQIEQRKEVVEASLAILRGGRPVEVAKNPVVDQLMSAIGKLVGEERDFAKTQAAKKATLPARAAPLETKARPVRAATRAPRSCPSIFR